MARQLVAGVEHRDRGVVVDRLGVQRPDHAQFVGDRLQVRQQVADPQAAAAAAPAARDRRHHQEAALARGHAGHALGALHRRRQVLAGVVAQRLLVVEQVDVRQPARLEQAQHAPRARREVRQARQPAGAVGGRRRPRRARRRAPGQQRAERERAEAAGGAG
jgi:hypothetical protein